MELRHQIFTIANKVAAEKLLQLLRVDEIHIMKKSVFILLLLLLPGLSVAVTVEAQGSAVISHGAVNKARLQAIQDAIRQAIIQSSAHITTSSMMSANSLVLDSTQVRASGSVKNVVVLDEWRDEEQIHVLVRAEVPGEKNTPGPRKSFRRKVAVTQFHVVDRRTTQDLPNIEIAYPRHLLRMLEQHGGIIGVDATDYIVNRGAGQQVQSEESPDRKTIMALAESLGVQFIVSGVLRDLTVIDRVFGVDSRQLDLELQVYDGITGIMVSRHTYNRNIDDGLVDSRVIFGSREFFATSMGVAINRLIEEQAMAIKVGLNKIPVTVKVVRSEGKKVYFNAGVTSLIKVGDMLMAYKVENEPVSRITDSMGFGYPEEPVATVTVKKIQPLFAMGELETDQVTLKPGDLLRFGW